MSSKPFTLIGHFVPSDSNVPQPLFIHVQSASSAEDATAQFARVWPWPAVTKPFAGHLEALDGTQPLDLFAGGTLSLTGKSLTEMVASHG